METAIGSAMIEVFKENDAAYVMWGDVHFLDWAFRRSGSKSVYADSHPLNRHHYVLNALDRDHRFEKLFVRVDVWHIKGYRKILVRAFKLKEPDEL